MIIVIVPMIAVALVLFSITADSETGKTDAQIAQGLRAAFAVYDADRARARPALTRVARDQPLARALADGDRAAASARLHALAATRPRARSDGSRRRGGGGRGRPDGSRAEGRLRRGLDDERRPVRRRGAPRHG